MAKANNIDEFEGCCGGTGHAEDCESREPAWDIGDLICRAPCTGCCPAGHKPKGWQALQDETAARARKMLEG